MFGGNRKTHVGLRRQSVFYFCVMLTQFDDVGNVVNDINKTFCRPILTMFAAFFCEEKPVSDDKTYLKIVARRCNDWCINARENWQNLRKSVQNRPKRYYALQLFKMFWRLFIMDDV